MIRLIFWIQYDDARVSRSESPHSKYEIRRKKKFYNNGSHRSDEMIEPCGGKSLSENAVNQLRI